MLRPITRNYNVMFCWVPSGPSHIDIPGNRSANAAAKTLLPITHISVPYNNTDLKKGGHNFP